MKGMNKEDIFKIGQTSYMVSANEDPNEPGGYIHSGAFILVDKERRVRGLYDGTLPEAVDKLKHPLLHPSTKLLGFVSLAHCWASGQHLEQQHHHGPSITTSRCGCWGVLGFRREILVGWCFSEWYMHRPHFKQRALVRPTVVHVDMSGCHQEHSDKLHA